MRKPISVFTFMPAYFLILFLVLLITIAGNHAVTTMSENSTVDNRMCIIIDAGHGGVDGGATSCTGVLESEINLNIAVRLNEVMQLLGFKTIMIRDTDRSMHTEGNTIASKKVSDLKNRVKIVNQNPDAILISIHQNYFSDSRYSGAQVFYGVKNKESIALAQHLQTRFIEYLNKDSNRKVKSAKGVYLMENITCPGVLVECGFISNFKEEHALRDEEYQKKLCCVIACACSQYLYNPNS